MSLTAAVLLRRRCTSRSRTSRSLSTARRSQNGLPLIVTAISSRCHYEVGQERRWRSFRAKSGPNFNTLTARADGPSANSSSRGACGTKVQLSPDTPSCIIPARASPTPNPTRTTPWLRSRLPRGVGAALARLAYYCRGFGLGPIASSGWHDLPRRLCGRSELSHAGILERK
jgi:hypothetical protein